MVVVWLCDCVVVCFVWLCGCVVVRLCEYILVSHISHQCVNPLIEFEINRNNINWTMCPMDPTCTRQERMKPVLFCHWGLY